jgi:DNA-binding NarL/FixJ family response regulator
MFQDTAAAVSNVVIVEDSLNIQIALKYLVESVSSLRVVAEWAKNHPGGWDIAVIDLMLAEGDGFEVIRRFSTQPDRGHIIVFSAYVTPVIQRYCRELGADAVFHKDASAEMAQHIASLHSQDY